MYLKLFSFSFYLCISHKKNNIDADFAFIEHETSLIGYTLYKYYYVKDSSSVLLWYLTANIV